MEWHSHSEQQSVSSACGSAVTTVALHHSHSVCTVRSQHLSTQHLDSSTMADTGGPCAAHVVPPRSTSSSGRAARRICAPPHHTAATHTTSCPRLLAFLVFASASLLDPTWQINCSRLTLSGPRCGITLCIRAPLGFQLNTAVINHSPVTRLHRQVSPGHFHWHCPQRLHCLQLPHHSCRSNLLSLRTRLA